MKERNYKKYTLISPYNLFKELFDNLIFYETSSKERINIKEGIEKITKEILKDVQSFKAKSRTSTRIRERKSKTNNNIKKLKKKKKKKMN